MLGFKVPMMILILLAPVSTLVGFVLLRLALLARRAKRTVGEDGLIGRRGRAETAIASEGAVFVRGELWLARSRTYIARGAIVRVTGLHGLTLNVEPETANLKLSLETISN